MKGQGKIRVVFFRKPVTFDNWLLFYAFCVLVFMFLVIPILIIIPVSFGSSQYLEFPPKDFSLKWYASYFSDPIWMSSTWRSFRVAFWVALLSSVIGTFAAFSLVRGKYRGKDFLMGLLICPLMVPIIVKAVAFYYFFSRLRLVGTELGLVLAHTCTGLPYIVVVVSSTLISFDTTLEKASMNLGANRLRTFMKITFPIIRPGILSGALFAFFSSFDDVIIAIFICGVRAITLPKKMWDGIRFELNPTIAAVASLLIFVSIITLVLVEIIRRSREHHKTG
ncbi:MAG: ABC transporter permease [Deltaproteobacteria bacterium]|nr:MAG: ABC transporter permease [Deltaproteobacteria bacterium]